jgi:hypothetical protein
MPRVLGRMIRNVLEIQRVVVLLKRDALRDAVGASPRRRLDTIHQYDVRIPGMVYQVFTLI